VIEHRRLLLLRDAIAGVEAREQRLAGRQLAAGRPRDVHRPREIHEPALPFRLFFRGVLRFEPIEIEGREQRAEHRVRGHRASGFSRIATGVVTLRCAHAPAGR